MIFNKLKDNGYEFMKLYASNYKVYRKKFSGTTTLKLWLWVAHGGYVELSDFYDNSTHIIETIRGIDWKTIDKEYIHIRFNHNDITKGSIVSHKSFCIESMKMCEGEENEYDKCYEKVRELHDREFIIREHTCKQIIKEIDFLITQGLKVG